MLDTTILSAFPASKIVFSASNLSFSSGEMFPFSFTEVPKIMTASESGNCVTEETIFDRALREIIIKESQYKIDNKTVRINRFLNYFAFHEFELIGS